VATLPFGAQNAINVMSMLRAYNDLKIQEAVFCVRFNSIRNPALTADGPHLFARRCHPRRAAAEGIHFDVGCADVNDTEKRVARWTAAIDCAATLEVTVRVHF
jgi:hypothetical protein